MSLRRLTSFTLTNLNGFVTYAGLLQSFLHEDHMPKSSTPSPETLLHLVVLASVTPYGRESIYPRKIHLHPFKRCHLRVRPVATGMDRLAGHALIEINKE